MLATCQSTALGETEIVGRLVPVFGKLFFALKNKKNKEDKKNKEKTIGSRFYFVVNNIKNT